MSAATTPFLEMKGITKQFPGVLALNQVDLSVYPGRVLALVGENGAGKSTTIKSMLNLVHPDSGEISYFGKAFPENETEIKKLIGYSTGSVNWYPRKRIRDIVAVVRNFYDTWD